MDALQHLLNKVNRVTSNHRHGNPVTKRDLDALANAQIEYSDNQKIECDSQPCLLAEEREIEKIKGGIRILKSLQTIYGNVFNFTEVIRQNGELLRTKIDELESKQSCQHFSAPGIKKAGN